MYRKMMKPVIIILLIGGLAACSSPEEKAADYIQNATALLQEGNLDKAELEYKNALQINQNQPDAWYGLAKIYERKQQWRQIYVTLQRIREMAPDHVDGRIMLAQLLLASNQLEQALKDAGEILELAPADARAHALMAAVQFRLDNFTGAQDEVDQALAIDPGHIEAILVRSRILIVEEKYDEAIRLLDGSIKDNPDNVSLYLMKIKAYAETGNSKDTEQTYLSLIKQNPDKNAFKQALVSHYISQKDIDGAETVIEQLVQSDPDSVDLKRQLIGFKNQYRSTAEAIALVKTYIDSDVDEYRYRFMLAELYERNKQSELALKVYEEIAVDDGFQPNGLEARIKTAVIELIAGNEDRARALVNEVLEQDKNNENGLLLLSGFQITDRKYDDALVSARTVLRDNPDSIKALGLLGKAYSAMGSTELAVESYTKAFQLSKGTPVIANQLATSFIQQRKFTQADEVLQESIAQGNQSLDAIKLLTQVKLALGEWDVAEKLARQLQKVEGQEALSEQLLGVAYQGKDLQGESIKAFQRAHDLAPSAVQPIVSIAQAYFRSGELEKARQFLDSVLSTDKENVTAYLLLGQLSQAEGKQAEAVAHFNKVIEIEPKQGVGYRNLAIVYRRSNELDKEEETINRAVAAMPERPILTMGQASIYERQGNFDKAIETYEALLKTDSNLLVAKNNLASLLTDHRQDQASIDKARSIAAELRSSSIPQFRDTYAWVSVKSGANLEEAVVILEGIVKENDQVDVYQYHLGEAYRKKGDSEKAMRHLNKAVELANPESDVAEKAKESLQQLK